MNKVPLGTFKRLTSKQRKQAARIDAELIGRAKQYARKALPARYEKLFDAKAEREQNG